MPFTGRAVYDSGVFNQQAEDVSALVTMISPFETPLLDRLAPPERPAMREFHEWLEDALNPDTVVTTATFTDVETVGLGVFTTGAAAVAGQFQVGDIFKVNATGEYIQVAAIDAAATTFTIARARGGTTAATIVAGSTLFFVSSAALEGADVSDDISTTRSRKTNYTHIFKKDIIVSGTVNAVQNLGGIGMEYEHQKMQRLREAIRDLEKAAIQGKSFAATLGSASAYRTARGFWDSITTNITTISSSGQFTPTTLNSILARPWERGANDVDIIVMDPVLKQIADNFGSTLITYNDQFPGRGERVTTFKSTFGDVALMLNRWMPARSLMVMSSQRAHVVPLNGRSFAHEQVAKTGDSMKGMVIGEYTFMLRNEDGMAKAYIPVGAP